MERLSSSKGEDESNSELYDDFATAPALRGVDLKKWIVPRSRDYYNDNVSLTDQGNKKRSS